MTRRQFPTISDEALASLRRLIGRPVRRVPPYIEVATRDAIRHWAQGIGDRNPVWERHGLAPPTILFAMDRVVSGYVAGLPGIHAMYAGTDFRWVAPICEGDRVIGESTLLDLEEKASAFARRAVKQTYRTVFTNQAGGVVCEADSWCFRTERDTARERGKYKTIEPHRYSDAEIERIRLAYRNEAIRGAAPRYWQDVKVGDALPEIVKGPLTVTSIIAFIQGWGASTCATTGSPSTCSSAIRRSRSPTRSACPSRPSASIGTSRSRGAWACPARTTTAPSASRGSAIS